MSDIMIDLETMGKNKNAPITQIGAVAFDREHGTILRRLHLFVALQSSVDHGAKMDVSTVLWWMEQSEEARAGFKMPALPLPNALLELSRWMTLCGDVDERNVWGNGATFDNVILLSAYQTCGLFVPWEFWGDRCYRTLKAENSDVPFVRVGVFHHAADDAESQARHVIAIDAARRGVPQ